MAEAIRETSRDRIKAGLGVALFHALLGYAFIAGLGGSLAPERQAALKLFDIPAALPPPPEKSAPAPARTREPEGAAAPPSRHAKASPVVAPPPRIVLKVPPPVAAAPLPAPALGSDRSTGASEIDGGGTGSGGEGAGTGSGGQGSGTGGGMTSPARRLSGSISGATDYPPAARRAGIEGSLSVRFTVRADGSVSGCRVLRSTASAELDATTCRLIERRFRYEPATDASGKPVPESISRTFDWLLPGRR